MNQIAHDYSRHSDDELHDTLQNVDVQRHPERALGLMQELDRRLRVARRDAAVVSSAVAARTGASFGEIDARARRPLFWRLFWWSVLVSVLFGLLQGLAMSIVDELLKEYYSGPPGGRFWVDSALRFLAITLIGIAFWRALLGVITKRTYGGLGVRIIKIEPPADAA